MDLSGTELNEISQYTLSYMWNLKQQQQLDKKNKLKDTDNWLVFARD